MPIEGEGRYELRRSVDLIAVLPGAMLLSLVLLAGCGPTPPQAPDKTTSASTSAEPRGSDKLLPGTATPTVNSSAQFFDVTPDSGIQFEYRDGQEAGLYSIVESLGGGVALFDFDGDGWPDLFAPGGGSFPSKHEISGRPGALFRNLSKLQFAEVTPAAGVAAAPFYSHGTAIGDFDNDGFADLLVTGYGGLAFFRNQGDGTFIEAAQAAGLTDPLWSSSAAWGDVNGDGVLDLYVAHYVDWTFENDPFCRGNRREQRDVCPPKRFSGLPDTLYFGTGEGTFRDASREAGLLYSQGDEPGLKDADKGLGVVMADVDLDGDLDIYVGNDTVPNYLYRNDGSGHLEEVGHQSGTALSERATPDGSMGVDVGDYNLDGLPDIWVANYERESLALYRNEGNFQFLHVSRTTGVTAVGALYVSFGTLFFDFDRDGDEDVFVSNGHVIRFPSNTSLLQVPLLFENRRGRFVNVAPGAGTYLAEPHLGRGVAAADLDLDGDLDLALSPTNEPTAVLRNDSTNSNHWLRVRLVGVRSVRDAVGARLTLTTSQGRQTRQVKGGASYLSHSELPCCFGVPAGATVESLEITWPAGGTQRLENVALDQTLTVIERPN